MKIRAVGTELLLTDRNNEEPFRDFANKPETLLNMAATR